MSKTSKSAEPFVIAVDWGTTSFRLWLVDQEGGVLGQSASNEGMTTAQKSGFAAILERHLASISAPPDCPVLMCGMVGARQGWCEAPYIQAPANLTVLAANAIRLDGPRDCRILPGVAQTTAFDVMRGEETQLLGLTTANMITGQNLVCIPGTHAKWVTLNQQELTGFTTYMTGELFAVLGRHSVLQHSLDMIHQIEADDPNFQAGLDQSMTGQSALTSRLFTIRAGSLLGNVSNAANAAKLSGLLIGDEIKDACQRLIGRDQVSAARKPRVTLVAAGGLTSLYRRALTRFGADVEEIDAEAAARQGLLHAARQIWGQQTS